MKTHISHWAPAASYMRITLITCLLVCSTAWSGCTKLRKRVEKDRTVPEMFGNDHAKIAAEFEKIARGKTTRDELEQMGFDLKAKNVQILVGVPAFRELFGPDVFRNMEQNGFDRRLPELNRYSLYQIPFKDTLKTSDYFYINKKTTTLVGWDTMFTIVLHDDLVVYAAPRKVYRDETKVDRAFLQGLLEIFGRMGALVGVVKP